MYRYIQGKEERRRRDKLNIYRKALFSFEGASLQKRRREKSGDDSKEEPPVPMPNTEVKLLNVDGTWRATAWESRKLPELSRGSK